MACLLNPTTVRPACGVLLGLMALSLAACSGGKMGLDAGKDNGGVTVDGAPLDPEPGQNPSGPPADTSEMHRLTVAQYKRAIAGAFEGKVAAPELSITDLKFSGFTAVGSRAAAMSQADAEAFTAAAFALGRDLVASGQRSNYPCAPKGAVDDDCAGKLVDRYGPRLWRRALSDDERDRYLQLAAARGKATNDFWLGMQDVFSALLQSPSFLFRSDTLDAGSDATQRAPLDSYALASRLSYLLWDEQPDAQLLASAADSSLSDPKVLHAQVDRMLADPRAATGLNLFLRESLHLEEILTMQKDPNDLTPEQRTELFEQAMLTVQTLLVDKEGDYRDLFTTRSMATNASLSKRYNLPAAKGTNLRMVQVTTDDRGGFLGLPGVIAMLSPPHRSSITLRGKYIRQNLLCLPMPAAPADVETQVAVDEKIPRTQRQSMALHVTNASCAACHKMMDPLGYALETFDQIGRYRTTDNNLPLDLKGELNGVPYTSALTYNAALREDPMVTRCVVRNFLTVARGVEARTDDPAVDTLLADFGAGGYKLKALLRAYATSPEFLGIRAAPTLED